MNALVSPERSTEAAAPALRRHWAPIVAGPLVSTVLGLLATGLVMHHILRRAGTAAAGADAVRVPTEVS